MPKSVSSISWFGGKSVHLDFILPKLPRTRVYVEPFGGSGAVLFNKPRSEVDVYNDLDTAIYSFMEAVRDDVVQLKQEIRLTPHSRRELELASGDRNAEDQARAAAVVYQQSMSAMLTSKAWNRATRSTSTRNWNTLAGKLTPMSTRLQGVTILNRDALDVIAEYDSPDTLFYLDPPYVHGTRGNTDAYTHELDDTTHDALADAARKAKGMVAVSGYASDFYEGLFPAADGWHRYDSGSRRAENTKGGSTYRVESLWCNYEVGK